MKKASSADLPPTQPVCHLIDDKSPRTGAASLWLWVAAGFLFLAVLWTGMFIAARAVDTRTVPLTTSGGRP